MDERAEEVGRQRRKERHQVAGQILFESRESVSHELLSELESATVLLLAEHQRAQTLQANSRSQLWPRGGREGVSRRKLRLW